MSDSENSNIHISSSQQSEENPLKIIIEPDTPSSAEVVQLSTPVVNLLSEGTTPGSALMDRLNTPISSGILNVAPTKIAIQTQAFPITSQTRTIASIDSKTSHRSYLSRLFCCCFGKRSKKSNDKTNSDALPTVHTKLLK